MSKDSSAEAGIHEGYIELINARVYVVNEGNYDDPHSGGFSREDTAKHATLSSNIRSGKPSSDLFYRRFTVCTDPRMAFVPLPHVVITMDNQILQ